MVRADEGDEQTFTQLPIYSFTKSGLPNYHFLRAREFRPHAL